MLGEALRDGVELVLHHDVHVIVIKALDQVSIRPLALAPGENWGALRTLRVEAFGSENWRGFELCVYRGGQ